MSTELGLAIRRKSATPASSTGIRRHTTEIAKLVDIDLCIGCKACEVACKEWNDLPSDHTSNFGSYQSHEDLTASTWDLMRFKEIELANGDLAWLIRKDSCLHCDDPGCLAACPAPGAIVQYTNGIVNFDQTKCIGCQYCVAGCPFDIPRFDQKTKKVYKCTLCVDRVSASLEPACVKSCPTGAIKFGGKPEMVAVANGKVDKLKKRGFEHAMLYDPSGVGGLHMMYVIPRGDHLEDYGLPKDPQVPGSFFSALSVLRKLGSISVWGGALATAIFYLRTGRRKPPPEDEAVAEAERLGQQSPNGGAAAPTGGDGDGAGNGAAPAGPDGAPEHQFQEEER